MDENINDQAKENISEDSIAMELMKELKEQSKAWRTAFFTSIRAFVIIVLAMITGFLLFLNQYNFESYSQDGSGYNNINTGEQGDVVNGTEIPANEEKER